MNAIISFIVFIVAILQIILFFKIWGMTNDVEKIKNKLTGPSKRISFNEAKITVRHLHFVGKDDEAYDVINAYVEGTIANIYKYGQPNTRKDSFSVNFNKIKERTAPLYALIGREMPQVLAEVNIEDYYRVDEMS